MKKLLTTILFLIITIYSISQNALPKIQELDENKGLFLENQVSDVKVDSDGYVWIISFSEIVRYDGEKFKNIVDSHIEHASFIKFYESPNHQKYVTDLNHSGFSNKRLIFFIFLSTAFI